MGVKQDRWSWKWNLMDFCAESQLSLALPELTTRPQSLCSTSDWCSQSTLFPRYFYFPHLAELGNNPRRLSKTLKRKSIRLQLQHSPSVFLLKYQTYTLSILFPTSKLTKPFRNKNVPISRPFPQLPTVSPPVGSGAAPSHLHGICHLLHPQGRRTRPQKQHDMHTDHTVCWVRSLHNSHLDRTQFPSITSYKRCRKSSSLNFQHYPKILKALYFMLQQ